LYCTGILTVFALGNDSIPHEFFGFMALMVIVFLFIEARRWTLFTFSRNRVLMLERGFYGHTLLGDVEAEAPAPDPWPAHSSWKVSLKLLMLAPFQHIEHISWGGVYRRLSRQYVHLLIAVYIGWCFKLYETRTEQSGTWMASVGAVGVVMLALVWYYRPPDAGLSLPGYSVT
jgi:uncharacterized membrane protein